MKDKSELQIKFEQNRATTLKVAQDFCVKESKDINPEELKKLRKEAQQSVDRGDFTEAMQKLEKLRDAKTGISMHTADKDGVPIIVRDARKAENPPVRETEAFEIQMLNAIRGAIDIAKIEGHIELKTKLEKEARSFMATFHAENQKKTQKELSALYKKEIGELGTILENNGIQDVYEKLNVAKDFQNFKDKHSNIVTLSSVTDKDGQNHTVVEAEVAMKGLTDNQKQEYQNIAQNTKPKPDWYKKMPEWEKKLTKEYADEIIAGEHVIPTQLRQIAGMKNAFEKTTAIYNNNTKKWKKLYASKHAGTVASFALEKELKQLKKKLKNTEPSKRKGIQEQIDKIDKIRQDITNENVKQAQEWIGNKKLHCNTLNAGPKRGTKQDKEIVKRTTDAMKKIDGRETNTAFNAWRVLGGANDLTGAKTTLKNIAENLGKGKDFKKIQAYLYPDLYPRKWWQRRIKKKNVQQAIHTLLGEKKINNNTIKILNEAIDLRHAVNRADKRFRLGKRENASLAVSRHLNQLTSTISDLSDLGESLQGMSFPDSEEILRMCASGKDRTGLAEHDQTAQAVATELKIDVKNIDGQLLKSGHTAQQAGGLSAGGGTVGCFGTKEENAMGLPISRVEGLSTIIEESATTNKIKKPKKASKLKRIKRFLENVAKSVIYRKYYSTLSSPATSSKSRKNRGMGKI